jgi:hypothetical protein
MTMPNLLPASDLERWKDQGLSRHTSSEEVPCSFLNPRMLMMQTSTAKNMSIRSFGGKLASKPDALCFSIHLYNQEPGMPS